VFRTQLPSFVIRILFIAASLGDAAAQESILAGSGRSPNIVIILADDQHWSDFGFMGNQRVHTPNLDELAAQSAIFPNCYVPSSVCRPSLATILTGLYPHEHGIYFNHGPPGNAGYNRMQSRIEYETHRENEFKLIQRLETLPKIFSSVKGYRCFQTGKFWEGHFSNAGFTDGMTKFTAPPTGQTFGGTRTLANGEKVAHGNGDWGLSIGRETMEPIKDFIRDCEEQSTPWMVWYAPYLPHLPHDAPTRFQQLAAQHPGVLPWEKPYFASIAQLDESIGELRAMVATLSDVKQTIFVFLSDNGWRPSQHRSKQRPQDFEQTKRSKRSPFDDGIRTPLLISWQGTITPQTQSGLTSSVDIFPTLASAAGIPNPHWANLPGFDLYKMLQRNDMIPESRAVYGEIYPGDATSIGRPQDDIAYRWIREGKMKLIAPHPSKKEDALAIARQSKPPKTESGTGVIRAWNEYLDTDSLFDVSVDPFEKLNLANSPSHLSSMRKLKSQLDAWWNPSSAARTPPKTELIKP